MWLVGGRRGGCRLVVLRPSCGYGRSWDVFVKRCVEAIGDSYFRVPQEYDGQLQAVWEIFEDKLPFSNKRLDKTRLGTEVP